MDIFERMKYEQLMTDAVELHCSGRYSDALEASRYAYQIAPAGSLEAGQAARDTAARYDRLGIPDESRSWAQEAYKIHDNLLRSSATGDKILTPRTLIRERAASAMYMGVVGFRGAIEAELNGQKTTTDDFVGYMRLAWSELRTAKSLASSPPNRPVDQYEVNASRRVSMAESLYGDQKVGLRIGVRAVGLAFFSESPGLETSSPNLSLRQRGEAKFKALLGGIAAVGINLAAHPKMTTTRRAALRFADKAL